MKKYLSVGSAAALAACLILFAAFSLEAKTIGIYRDQRIGNLSGAVASLTNNGWQVTWLAGGAKGLANEEKLAACDVLYFAGGFNRYFFADYNERRAVIRYAAKGGGILMTGFRGGYVRSANRPMFPEIGAVHNRLSSSWLDPVGSSIVAKAFGGTSLPAGAGDHLVLKLGPKGETFAANSGDPVGAVGAFYNGRVVVYGAHFMYSPGDDLSALNERLFLAMLDYLTQQKKPDAASAAKAAGDAECDFIRRERMWDLTLDERGPDAKAGVIPSRRDWYTAETEAYAYKLGYFAGFVPAKDAKRCRDLAAKLLANAENIRKAADALKSEADAAMRKMSLAELKAFKVEGTKYDTDAVNAAFDALYATKEVEAAKAIIDELRPAVAAAKTAALKTEIAADLKTVPALVKQLASENAKTRYVAATEIGRISPDDAAAVAALAKALDDTDAQVRSQAAISLGWMQAKGAVDALIAKTTSDDIRLSRRAIQALGQIGDTKAIAAVMQALDKKDLNERHLAILALGHLKAKSAVAKLLALATNEEEDLAARECAILALGFIGDASVKATLEKFQANKEDRPRRSRSKKGTFFRNPYSVGHHGTSSTQIGLSWAAEQALADLARGGLAATGVKQLEAYRSKDAFYAITKQCNAFAGRVYNGTAAYKGERAKLLPSVIREAGFTGIHNAWGTSGWEPESYKAYIRELGELGLLFIDVLPGYAQAGIAENEFRLAHLGDCEAYRGYWCEETWQEPGLGAKEFARHLEQMYGKDWRKTLGLRADELAELDRCIAGNEYFSFANRVQGEKTREANYSAPWDSTLRTVMLEVEGRKLADCWTESQDYLHGRRKGFAHTYVVSTADPVRYPRDNAQIHALDSIGLESYQSFGRSSSYFMRRYRDGEARSSMSELYNWYCPSGEHAFRGFWQNAIHSKCFFNFTLYHIFKHASSEYLWVWEEDRWERCREVFQRVRANREYYAIAPSAANAAVLFSGRSSSVVRDNPCAACAVPQRGDQDAMAAWVALTQLHVPADVIYADDISLEKLSRYRVLYLPESRFLGDVEIANLRAWVKAGGVLISQGTSSLFNGRTLKQRANYALADLFGADYQGTDYLKPEESDTFARRRGIRSGAFKFVPGLEQRYHFLDSVERDLKPAKSVRTAKFGAEAAKFLAGVKDGDEIEIDAAIGIDRVRPTTAVTLATFKDGRHAVLANAFGRGRVYFFTADYPMLGHVTSEWEMMPNKWVFWKNVRETLGAMVKSGLEIVGATLPVEVTGVSGDVEVTVDALENNYVIHMLDYNVRNAKVTGAKLNVPGTCAIKRVFYPDTKTDVKLNGRCADLRDFAGYDMLVVEFE